MKHLLSCCLLFFCFLTCAYAQAGADTLLLKKHLHELTKQEGYRNYRDLKTLNAAADYIKQEFAQWADTTFFQEYTVGGQVYKNVIARFGSHNPNTIVVGAHYDVAGNQPGADDNGSGTAGLLELARLLKDKPLRHRLELVAYTLEEPPFFRTENMGSYIHAKSLKEDNAAVAGMISLEMIGYFSDAKGSQEYPVGALKLVYGNKGNYITAVRSFSAGGFAKRFARTFKQQGLIRTKRFTGPAWLPGLDFSDHLNYWKFGYSALMITDTAFYRNKNYHQPTDSMETLNLPKMALVVDQVLLTLLQMDKKERL